MLLKRKVRRVLRLSKIWRKANERQSEMDKRRRNYVIERNELKVGQKVYVAHHPLGRNKIQAKYKPDAHQITKRLSPQTYQIVCRGTTKVVNRANVRPCDNLIDHNPPIIPRRSERCNKGIPPNRYGS